MKNCSMTSFAEATRAGVASDHFELQGVVGRVNMLRIGPFGYRRRSQMLYYAVLFDDCEHTFNCSSPASLATPALITCFPS